jgi:hypothetical protein
MRACEELVGKPKYQVIRSQTIAPINPARITYSLTALSWIIPLPIVLATWVSNPNAPMKLKKAAHMTAKRGVNTRVETTVAIEFAAS